MSKSNLKDEIAQPEKTNESTQVDLSVLAEYRKRVEEHASQSSDLAEAVSSRDAAKRKCDKLWRLRLEGFMEGFSITTARLKEMYQMITMGGNTELEYGAAAITTTGGGLSPRRRTRSPLLIPNTQKPPRTRQRSIAVASTMTDPHMLQARDRDPHHSIGRRSFLGAPAPYAQGSSPAHLPPQLDAI